MITIQLNTQNISYFALFKVFIPEYCPKKDIEQNACRHISLLFDKNEKKFIIQFCFTAFNSILFLNSH